MKVQSLPQQVVSTQLGITSWGTRWVVAVIIQKETIMISNQQQRLEQPNDDIELYAEQPMSIQMVERQTS